MNMMKIKYLHMNEIPILNKLLEANMQLYVLKQTN